MLLRVTRIWLLPMLRVLHRKRKRSGSTGALEGDVTPREANSAS